MNQGKVIVVGASAGGMEAFLQLASGLDRETSAAIEQSLWAALRLLQERGDVLQRLSEREAQGENPQMAQRYRQKERESRRHAERLQELLAQAPRADESW